MSWEAVMAGFGGVYLEVGEWDDVAACRDFYRDLLGMELRSEEDGHSIYFEVGAQTFGFHVGEAPPRETRWAVNIVLTVDDGVTVDDEATRLKAAGVTLFMEPEDMPWGMRVFTFLDPAGHAVWYTQPI
jgi:catechol 2,3-dioxygenase-like lactoylglutathione lyase family enzyme